MLSAKMEKALNDQINAELFSYYLYLSMSTWFTSRNLGGFAGWMIVQAGEENEHAMKFYGHIHERGGRVKLQPIEGPQVEWNSPLEAFKAAYEHEKYITGRIHNLVKMALEESDYASNSFLQWFVDEQVEEEAAASEIVERLKMIGDHTGGLMMLDHELGKRRGGSEKS
jgi:ferritin